MEKSNLFPNFSDISFANKDPDLITSQIILQYERFSGRTLSRSDPVRLFLDAIILEIVQQRNIIDYAAKQNLLAYAEGNALDFIGALLGVYRLSANPATCTITFMLPQSRTTPSIIPTGTRVSAGSSVIFATISELVIPAGKLSGSVEGRCTIEGTIGNGYYAGQVNRVVDALPFDVQCENITQSSGGYNAEDDEALRERILIAPESFSVAGPKKAYEFFARSANSEIIDVQVLTPPDTNPGCVEIYPLMSEGTLPSSEVINQIYEICNAKNIRPDTDYVSVKSPVIVNYSLDMTYWIDEVYASRSEYIRELVEQEVTDWILWERKSLGRDINPSELTKRVVQAGAKRVEIRQPSFGRVREWQVAICSSKSVIYGGLEAN